MSKFWYPITSSYVSTWGMDEALRELIANAIDGEAEMGADFSYKYDASRRFLTLINQGARVDIRALYFGASSKGGDARTIGQYGEGLKLAMLVCAREGHKLVIKNQNEQWIPSIAQDKLGQDALCVDIKDTPTKNQDFKVELWGVDEQMWEEAQARFLRLSPCKKKEATRAGECLFDPDYKGHIFVKGVKVTVMPQAQHGYNFFDLDIGRDRSIPTSWQLESAIAQIWAELATRTPEYSTQVFDLLMQDNAEAEGLRYNTSRISGLCAVDFRDRYGQDAIPVVGVADAERLKHFGRTGVVVPVALYSVLRGHFPQVHDLQEEYRRSIENIVQLSDLTPQEEEVIRDGMALLHQALPIARDNLDHVIIANFKDDSLMGLFKDGELYIGRPTLKSVGSFLVTVIHEYAHHFGVDGAKAHIDAIQSACEKVVQCLYEANRRTS